MLEVFLFVGLPYAAILVCVAGSIYRFRSERYGVSSLSSQFLESEKLRWGSVPWHLGIGVVFLGHLAAFLMPGAWKAFLLQPHILVPVEMVGLASALLCALGLLVLILRRLTTARLQPVTTLMDLVVLFLLFLQVILGILTAMNNRWGSVWATQTTTPYLWSLLTLHPDASYIAGMPLLVKAHLTGAWVLLLSIPFSRLVHMFSLPLEYIFRPPQKVVWNTHPHHGSLKAKVDQEVTRRLFLKGAFGMLAGGGLLSLGVFDQFFQFFRGPRLDREQEAEQLEITQKRLKKNADEKALELERLRNDTIFIAALGELSPTKGKYFIDYQMRPALAFLGADGLPVLLSAKCTHLGCTVGSEVNAEGRLLCPCHVSFFNVATGVPDAGSPAKDPLAKIGWVLVNEKGQTVLSRGPSGVVEGTLLGHERESLKVHIARRYEEGLA
jgi:nitrate reductase gamma subunit